MSRGILDTSVFIAQESGHPLDTDIIPEETAATVITLAELKAGVLAATDTETKATRLKTLESLNEIGVLEITADAAHEWARLRHRLAESGRRINVNDLWIAAIACAMKLPVVTQDHDFDPLSDLDGPEIILV
jgi:predicted nucleic acid-binding protein